MPTSARTSLGFFGQFADVGIRAPEQNGLVQQALGIGRFVRYGRLPAVRNFWIEVRDDPLFDLLSLPRD